MSEVETRLETKEMSKTLELMDSFETVDETKDSDEESFHLFLEGDEDNNKSDDKITEDTESESEQLTQTEPPEGKQEEETEKPPDERQNEALDEQKIEAPVPEIKGQTETFEGNENNELISINKDILSDLDKLEQDETDRAGDQENTANSELEKEVFENTTSILSENVDSIKIVNETEKTPENVSDSNVQLDADLTSENEDDILDKHDNEEIGNTVEDVDPNIEESLLNEYDDLEDESSSRKCEEKQEIHTSNEVNQAEVTDSVVDTISKESETTVPANSENTCDVVQEKNCSENNIVPLSESQKCDENSSSSNADMEDLLDISMIKDSAQDDADIANDQLNELNQENEDSNSKSTDNVDETSNSGNSDEDDKNSETSEIMQNELSDSEKEKDANESDQEYSANKIDDQQSEKGEKTAEENITGNSENTEEKSGSKRNLSNPSNGPSSKRIKLTENDAFDTELKSIISFNQFMSKSHLKKLTRADLEELCSQKFCEVILHKSELGETNHQLKIQEQTIETLRRDQAVLTKQIKDLEIVNKKLMNEILASTGVKPLLPVKITRSVGLQVRLPSANDPNAAKRRSLPNPHKVTAQPSQAATPKVRTITTNTPTRTVIHSSPPKQTTPLLNQALNRSRTPVKTPQPRNVLPQKTNVTNKIVTPPPEKRAKTAGSFIDLTDEDDKRANNKVVKPSVPQGVRISSVSKTLSSVLPSVSTSTPQLMYVVQSNSQLKQGVLTTSPGQKALLVNFQPTNGVINTINSSSVSVIPKVATNIQIKPKPSVQSSLLKVNKHPAALPNPPAVQTSSDKSLKPIPPRPTLSIRKTSTGIILQWRMPYDLGNYEAIASYQLYAYQETSAPPSTDMWRKVGDVKAMALPMACTLTQFADKNKYYFAVRPVDIHKRIGNFSHPVLSE